MIIVLVFPTSYTLKNIFPLFPALFPYFLPYFPYFLPYFPYFLKVNLATLTSVLIRSETF